MFITAAALPRTERKAEHHKRGPEAMRNKMVQLRSRPSSDGASHAAGSAMQITLRRSHHHHQSRFVPVYPGKASIRSLFESAFPAARGLCGNGREAKTGGMYG
jgi:hypothetical protein